MIKHGPLYQDVKCVCNDFSISVDQNAGMNARTLLNRRILVTLNLEEVRTGDFEEYKFGHVVKGDNLAGWEEIFDTGSMDPGNDRFENLL